MAYVLVAIAVIVLVGGFVTFLVFNATRKSDANARGDDGPPGIGTDPTPLGDTSEHAGEQTTEGTTVGGQDAADSGGSGTPVHSGYAGTPAAGAPTDPRDPDQAAHVARPGEGEGHERFEFDGQQPERREPAPREG